MTTGAPFDVAAFDHAAVASTRRRIAPLTAADLDRATVNVGWDVRAVLAHLIGGNLLFAKAFRGEHVEWNARDTQPITAVVEQFDESTAELASTIAGLDGDLERQVTTPAGRISARRAIAVHATDMLVHGWDLAAATDQDRALDDGLCRTAIAIIERFPAAVWGDPRFYAKRVATTSDSPVDQLIALTGRDPDTSQQDD